MLKYARIQQRRFSRPQAARDRLEALAFGWKLKRIASSFDNVGGVATERASGVNGLAERCVGNKVPGSHVRDDMADRRPEHLVLLEDDSPALIGRVRPRSEYPAIHGTRTKPRDRPGCDGRIDCLGGHITTVSAMFSVIRCRIDSRCESLPLPHTDEQSGHNIVCPFGSTR